MYNPEHFSASPLVGILRGTETAQLGPLAEAVITGGLLNLEVTLNTAGAAAQIEYLCQLAGDRANVGAGTVCSMADMELALAAGASFIVTPAVVPEVIQACVTRGIPVFPGAFTPTEILQAHKLGAAVIKVFPADALGPNYIASLRGPFPQIRTMPTGGITLEAVAAYKAAGAAALGLGGPLFSREHLAAGDWHWLHQRARAFVNAWMQSR